jgi:hypothetical protein
MLQTLSRICFVTGGTLKIDAEKMDEILNNYCYIVVYTSTVIGRLYPEIRCGFFVLSV